MFDSVYKETFPFLFQFILIYSWVDYSEVTYGDYVYPQWAAGLGWLMTLAVVCGIFVTGFGLIIRQCVRGVSSTHTHTHTHTHIYIYTYIMYIRP